MTQRLKVSLGGVRVGELGQDQAGRIVFQYDSKWLLEGFDLSPGSLSFEGLPQSAMRGVFDGLHGVFNDSLPDGWGLLLMDRALKQKMGLNRPDITPLHRLAYIGERGMGALEYAPILLRGEGASLVDLSQLAEQAEGILKGTSDQVLEELRILGGSPGGARPKVTVAFSKDMKTCQTPFSVLPEGFTHWMVKFRAGSNSTGGDEIDSGRMEMIYAEMARASGIEMPRTHLLELNLKGQREAYFAVERFDRVSSRKIHVLSLAGLAYANHREPCLDYGSGVLAATKKLTKSQQEVERAYRLMVFNVLAHNKDDHAKNFAYLYDLKEGCWRLSPGFDLTFNFGMSNQHTTSVNGSGLPVMADLKKLAQDFRVERWKIIVEEVAHGVSSWHERAKDMDLSQSRMISVQSALNATIKRVFD